jgi:hypothetical protein
MNLGRPERAGLEVDSYLLLPWKVFRVAQRRRNRDFVLAAVIKIVLRTGITYSIMGTYDSECTFGDGDVIW